MQEIIRQECTRLGHQFINIQRLHGGDVSQAFAVETSGGRFFIKMNDAAQCPGLFANEAEGLRALALATPLRVPGIIAVGETEGYQYLVLEWLEKTRPAPDFWERMGHGLASLHQNSAPQFGWAKANNIGPLVQPNHWASTWPEFYTSRRIMPLVEELFNRASFTKKDIGNAEGLYKKLSIIFPTEPPALLHGDLWSGNYMSVGGLPAIFDPAVYFGHREMDIAMTLLFGGFDPQMYAAYHEVFPLEKDWRKRLPVAQLYPLLVHAVLFGGGYVGQCKNILAEWR